MPISTAHAATALAFAVAVYTIRGPINVCLALSAVAAISTYLLVPLLAPVFIRAGLHGKDVHRKERPLVAESLGLVAATVYLGVMFLFIPAVFSQWISMSGKNMPLPDFPFLKLGEFLSALLSLQSMTLLGFADDLFDIRWRTKLPLPLIASIPLLMVYYVSGGITWVMVPLPLRTLLGASIDLGPLYYLYMSLVSVFCTNSINILAGVNGVEVAQSLIIALSILINDLMYIGGSNEPAAQVHLFSLYLILPFIGVTIALMMHNWFPARVFVGDTYCYFAGMTFAVVGILGHFSKTLLLLFLPQIFNFLLSLPQLAHIVPCPRHRMPILREDGRLDPSVAPLEELSPLGTFILRAFEKVGLVELTRGPSEEGGVAPLTSTTNLTILNLILLRVGPLREDHLVMAVMLVQVLGSAMAFLIRYRLVFFLYDILS